MPPRLLIVCPTRGRPELLARMLGSFDATRSPGTDIVIVAGEDDPRLDDYLPLLRGRRAVVGPRRFLVQTFNDCTTKLFPGTPYYGEVNDDHFYRTRGWDKTFIDMINDRGNGWGIACGNDMIQTNWHAFSHPSACVISGNIIRTLGHFVWPKLLHLFTDVYLRDLSRGIGRLFYTPEVVIEHRHWVNGRVKFEGDENYKWIYSQEQQKAAYATHQKWLQKDKDREIGLLRTAMEREGVPFLPVSEKAYERPPDFLRRYDYVCTKLCAYRGRLYKEGDSLKTAASDVPHHFERKEG